MSLRLTTLLWAILFNAAFFMPDYFGFGAVVGIIFFLYSLLAIKNISRSVVVSKGFWLGFWWGVLVFFPQLYWVWSVLYHFSERSFLFKLGAYGLLCSYFAFTSAWWVGSMMFIGWYARRTFVRLTIYLFATLSYFMWFGDIGALILASGDGYPLLNPLIPLCAYRWFVKLVCLVSSLVVGSNHFYDPLPASCSIISLKPMVTQQNKHQVDPSSLGQKIYHQLCDIQSSLKYQKNNIKTAIYCGAESFFPFPLNNYPELVALWGSAISHDASLLLGAYYQCGQNVYQAAFLIQRCRIKKIYVKKHLVPFIEHIPYAWSTLNSKASLLSEQQEMFVYGKNSSYNKRFALASDCIVLPQVCSEFIFSHTTRCFRRWVCGEKSTCVVWLVNDSWFIGSFKRVLLLAGCLRGAWIGLPVISISHELMSNKCSVNRLGF